MDEATTEPNANLAGRVQGSGPPLVLAAGTGYPAATWPSEMLESLSAEFSVLTFDYRGTGTTPGTDGDYSTRLFAADLAALMDTLQLGPAHVLGHSMGGRVAQWLALDRPELVRTLILAATGPGRFPRLDGPPQTTGIPLHTAVGMVELGYRGYLTDNIRRLFFPPEFLARHPLALERLVDSFWDNRPTVRDYDPPWV